MAEQILIDTSDKENAYREVIKYYKTLADGETNVVARLSTLVCLLKSTFEPRYFWCGFYIVDEQKQDELVIGPYQGTIGCLRIPFKIGVCGKAARERKTQIVDDVHEISDHIACDSRSNSEIVVPLFKNNVLYGVLDVDSTSFGAFDIVDKIWLEKICNMVFDNK